MQDTPPMSAREFMDAVIRLALIALLIMLCWRVMSPFINLVIWSVTAAIALYPAHQAIAKRAANKQGLASTILLGAMFLMFGAPTAMLASSLVTTVQGVETRYENGELHVPEVDPRVADLPIVGDKLFESWTTARDNFPAFLEAHQSTLGNLASSALSTIGNTAIGLLMLIIAFIVAGVFMAYGDLGRRASGKLLRRIVGPDRGPKLQKLAVATVRSVALGVLGVAAIQALLVGVGLAFADVPGAGIWAIVTLVVAVIQVPLLVITIPAIAYIWSGDGGTAMNVVWTVYLLLAGLADNVLKPMFLGRGVEAPMPVILIGALGGMASAGIIGLFAGAVLLTVFYEVFMAWVAEEHDEEE